MSQAGLFFYLPIWLTRNVLSPLPRSIFFWRVRSSPGEIATVQIPNDHTSLITSLAYNHYSDRLLSAGMDKKIFGHDLDSQSQVFRHVLGSPILAVQQV